MLEITPIKAFNDNYLWLFKEEGSDQVGLVDPGDGEVVLAYLEQHDLALAVILITHHHADHTGGIERLLQKYDVPVYGPDSVKIPLISNPVKDGDSINLLGEDFHVLEVPGHTLDHIAYYTNDNSATPLLFSGDTLFAGGCGRVFEGSFKMMHNSLQKLARLVPQTQIFCAHEYTMANLAFAAAVSPDDQTLADRIKQEQEKRDNDIATVPSSIALELKTNPFLRCNENSVKQSAAQHADEKINESEEAFAVLRQWKDSF